MAETEGLAQAPSNPAPAATLAKTVAIAVAGTSIEWYDFFIYGTAAALVFPKLFFPADLPPLIALLASFSTVSVGFIARPVGGIVFGHFGDCFGRKKALIGALLTMGLATTLIGVLPGYATAGVLAPVALVVLRFVQGLEIGGQWGGAILLITESAPNNRRVYYGSFAQAGITICVVTANLVFLIANNYLAPEAFLAWGWRLPFLFSVLLVLIALYIQLHLEDTVLFKNLKTSGAGRRSPVLEALRLYPRQITLIAGAFMAMQVTFYILLTFVVAYGSSPTGLGMSRNIMLIAVMIGAALMAPTVILCAALSDKVGRRLVYIVGAVFLGVWSLVFFPMLEMRSFFWVAVAVSGAFIGVGAMYGPQGAFVVETFNTQVRYSGASLGYQGGAIIGGALAPIVATALLAQFGDTFAIAVYMALACVVTISCVLGLEETYTRDLS